MKKEWSKILGSFRIIFKKDFFRAVSILALLLVVFYRDVVFEGKTFLIETAAQGTMPMPLGGAYKYSGDKPGFVSNDPGAIAWAKEPIDRFISKSIKNGVFPLWNPYIGLAGSPLLADGYTGPLEPIQFLFFLLPTRFWMYAVDYQLLLRYLIAGIGCYLLARRLGLNFISSISVGVVFMFSGYFLAFANHPQIKTEVLLPLIVYGFDRLLDFKDKKGFWISSLLIGWAIIAAMPESTFFSLFIGSFWYFYKSFFVLDKGERRWKYIKLVFIRFAGSAFWGGLVSAAFLLPLFENVYLSKHGHTPGSGIISLPIWNISNLIFQVKNFFHMQLSFFAIFSFSYLTLNFFTIIKKYRYIIVFFGGYFLVMTLSIFDFPPTNWIKQLPILNQIVFLKYAFPSIAFSLAVLTGVFIDNLNSFKLSYRNLSLAFLIVVFIFIVLPVSGNPEKSLSFYFSSESFMRSTEFYILVVIALTFVMVFLYFNHDVTIRVLQFSFLLLVFSGPLNSSAVFSRPERYEPYVTPPFVDYVLKDKEAFRIFALNGILYPNISSAYKLSDIRWLNALVYQRTYDFSEKFLESREVKTIRLTGSVLPVSDEMFNLLNVKYIFSSDLPDPRIKDCRFDQNYQPYLGRDTIHDLIVEQNPEMLILNNGTIPMNVNGEVRTIIPSYPPQKISVNLDLPQSPSVLNFSFTMHPSTFFVNDGDGVTFGIELLDGNHVYNLFEKYINPKSNPCDQRWFDGDVDLSRWAGHNIKITFFTDPGPLGDSSSDWAYWGDIQLINASHLAPIGDVSKKPEYNLVFQDDNVMVYQNQNVFPRAFMVYKVFGVDGFNEALDELDSKEHDLRNTAIVEGVSSDFANRINENASTPNSMTGDYELVNANDVKVEVVDNGAPGLLVVTDQYYPGWRVYVNGKPSKLYAVDGIFRGVFLEKGDSVVEFKYQPLSFTVGSVLSIISLLIIFVSLISKRENSNI